MDSLTDRLKHPFVALAEIYGPAACGSREAMLAYIRVSEAQWEALGDGALEFSSLELATFRRLAQVIGVRTHSLVDFIDMVELEGKPMVTRIRQGTVGWLCRENHILITRWLRWPEDEETTPAPKKRKKR